MEAELLLSLAFAAYALVVLWLEKKNFFYGLFFSICFFGANIFLLALGKKLGFYEHKVIFWGMITALNGIALLVFRNKRYSFWAEVGGFIAIVLAIALIAYKIFAF